MPALELKRRRILHRPVPHVRSRSLLWACCHPPVLHLIAVVHLLSGGGYAPCRLPAPPVLRRPESPAHAGPVCACARAATRTPEGSPYPDQGAERRRAASSHLPSELDGAGAVTR